MILTEENSKARCKARSGDGSDSWGTENLNQYWPTQAVLRKALKPKCGADVLGPVISTWTKPRFLIAAFLLDACYLGYVAIQHPA